MGKEDTITKEYMKNPAIFADVFNQFLYKGRQVIRPDQLTELDTTEIALPYGTGRAIVPEQRYRDVKKLLLGMTDGRTAYCILALEDESKVNYAMPVKSGLYDFMQLAHQVSEAAKTHRADKTRLSGDEFLSGFKQTDRLLPVVTLTVYFGANRWDGVLSLREMYAECDREILKYTADYHVNLVAPYHLSDSEIDGFQTSLREVMRYIKYSNDKQKLGAVVSSDQRFKSMDRSAADVINVVTGSKFNYPKGKGTVDMCLAIERMREESERIGEKRGKIEGAILTCQAFGISKEKTVEHVMQEFKQSGEKAKELVALYWK